MSKQDKNTGNDNGFIDWSGDKDIFTKSNLHKWLRKPAFEFKAFVYVLSLILFLMGIMFVITLSYHAINSALSIGSFPMKNWNDFKNLALIVGGIAAFIAALIRLWIADRQTKATEKQVKLTEEKHEIEKENNLALRLTKANQDLGATRIIKDSSFEDITEANMELRLGAIDELEQIAFSSYKHHWPIMERLTTYIQQNSQCLLDERQNVITNQLNITKDIRAIINVIGRRNAEWIEKERDNGHRLDLSYCNLMGIIISGNANFSNTYFGKTNFAGANVHGADFSNSSFHSANLVHARMKKCDLQFVELSGATFKNTDFDYSNFYQTNGLVNKTGLTISESIFLIKNSSHHNIGPKTPISNSLISDKINFENRDPTTNYSISENHLNKTQIELLFRLLKQQSDPFSLDWPTLIKEAKRQE